MSSDPVVCPFCNSTITGVERKPGSTSALCPRCGEPLPADVAGRVPAPIAPAGDNLDPSRLRARNARVGGSVVMLMVLMAVLAMGVAVATVDTRRTRDTARATSATAKTAVAVAAPNQKPTRAEPPVTPTPPAAPMKPDDPAAKPATPTPPTKSVDPPATKPAGNPPKKPRPPEPGVAPRDLAAIQYLPADCNLLVGVQAADMAKDPAWLVLMFQLAAAGTRGNPLAQLETLTGLKPEQIDHVVFGGRMKVDDLNGVMVVRTKTPVDRDALKARLRTRDPQEFGTKTAYPVPLPGLPYKPLLWIIDDTTLMIANSADDLDNVPETHAPGGKHLPPAIRTLFANRLSPTAKLWVVGERLDRWKTVPFVPPGTLTDEEQDLIGLVDEVAGWVEPLPGATVRVRLKPLKPTGEKDLKKYFESRPGAKVVPEQGWLSVSVPVEGFRPKRGGKKAAE